MRKKNKTLFDFIDLEDGDAAVLLARAQFLKDSYMARRARDGVMNTIHIESKGECEGCGDKNFIRWVDNGVYICYDCYIHDLQEYQSHCVPVGNIEYMDEYMGEGEWEEYWEEEFPHMVEEEESDVLELFDVFKKQLGT